MCLRLVFLLITRVITWLRLSRRDEEWKRRDPAPAPPAGGSEAPSGAPPETDLGGPRPARGPGDRDTESSPPGIAAAGHRGPVMRLAPRHHLAPLGNPVHARQDWPADTAEHQGPGPPARPRKYRKGVPQDPRRDPAAPRPGRHRPGTTRATWTNWPPTWTRKSPGPAVSGTENAGRADRCPGNHHPGCH
jgi:hypothetical protein